MSKEAVTISVEHSIIEAHRGLGTNVSKLCNDALASYLTNHGQDLIKNAEKQTVFVKEIVKTSQEQAGIEEKVQALLARARLIKAENEQAPPWRKHKYDYCQPLKEACKLSGLPMHKMVRRL